MLDRIELRHFRALESIIMEDLGTINLIAGQNNSGKTSLLEALFLATGIHNPGITLNANVTRMERPDPLPINASTVKTYWKAFFTNLADNQPIEISLRDSALGSFCATISRQATLQGQIPFDAASADSLSNTGQEYVLVLESTEPSRDPTTRVVRLTSSGISIEGDEHFDFPINSAIVLSRQAVTREDVDRLSQLRAEKRHNLVVQAIKAIDPRIHDIETSTAAGEPTIWANGHLPQLVPLALYGGGVVRIARLILTMSAAENGLVLIDEIETGLHHSVLPQMWEAVRFAAREFDVQVFATTHSYECIEAAQSALNPDDWRYHRIGQRNGIVECQTYPMDALGTAFKHFMEVR